MNAGENNHITKRLGRKSQLVVLAIFVIITSLFITFSHKLLVVELGFVFIWICFIYLAKDFTPIILLLIVLRPIVDIWTEYRLDFVGIQMVMTVGIIFSIIFHLVTNKNEHKRKQIVQDPVVILFAVYLLFNFLSIAVNPKVAVSESLSLTFRFVSFLAMYVWGMVLFGSHRKRDWIIASYIVSAIFIAMVGYYQFASGDFHSERGVLAIQGTFSHPNMFANFLILANLACIYFLLQKKYILLNLIVLIANLFLFSQTYSRMAIATWIFVVFVLALTFRKKSIYFLPFLILAAVVIFYKFPSIIDFWVLRFDTIDDPDAIINSRSIIFSALIYWFKQNPLIGIGPATFYPYYFPYAQPHNELLRNMAEVGLLGTIPFILVWAVIIKRFFSVGYFINVITRNTQKYIIFLMILAVVMTSITSNIGTKPELLWPLFLLFGSYSRCNETRQH